MIPVSKAKSMSGFRKSVSELAELLRSLLASPRIGVVLSFPEITIAGAKASIFAIILSIFYLCNRYVTAFARRLLELFSILVSWGVDLHYKFLQRQFITVNAMQSKTVVFNSKKGPGVSTEFIRCLLRAYWIFGAVLRRGRSV